MMVGSVRGKEMLWMPCRVAQGGRWVGGDGLVWLVEPWAVAVGRMERSVGGQVRLVPPLMDSVGWPHWAQNGLRAFQSR